MLSHRRLRRKISLEFIAWRALRKHNIIPGLKSLKWKESIALYDKASTLMSFVRFRGVSVFNLGVTLAHLPYKVLKTIGHMPVLLRRCLEKRKSPPLRYARDGADLYFSRANKVRLCAYDHDRNVLIYLPYQSSTECVQRWLTSRPPFVR